MKKNTLLLILLVSVCLSNKLNSQTTLAFQGFEGTGNDTWSYSLNVPMYNNNSGTDLWTTYTSSLGAEAAGLEGPRTGSTYWVGRDLDNPHSEGVTGDTTPDHFMDFTAIATGGVETKLTIYFDFYGYDSSDYIFYEVFYDNGNDWSSADVRVDVNPKPSDSNSNSAGGTWQEFSTIIPASASHVRVRIGAHQNGASDYLGIDDIKLETTAPVGDTTAPVFENSTPNASSTTQTGFTLNTDIDEAGTIYYVVVADGASAPTAAEVKAGTGSGGSGQITSGNQSVTTGSFTHSFNVTGLSAATAYDVYVVAEDDEGTPNLQSTSTLVNVTTTDTIDPVITVCAPTPANIVANTSCQGTAPDFTGLVTATDNSGVTPTITQSPPAGATLGLGTTTITITATDGSGNTATCSVNQTVVDSTKPTVTCPGNQAATPNGGGIFILSDFTGAVTASDNCTGSPVVTQSPAAGTVLTQTTTVTITATDGSDNKETCTFDVVLPDTTPPSISSVSLASNNSYIDVTFDEGVYNTNGGAGALEETDFSLSITGGTATNPTVTSVTTTGGTGLSGGETTIRVNFSVTGTTNGSEILEVDLGSNAVFDAAGNFAVANQTSNNTASLNVIVPYNRVFWTPHTGQLKSSNLDGSDVKTFTGITARYIEIDSDNEKIYYYKSDSNTGIYKADLDGTNQELIVLGSMDGFEIDYVNSKLYWAEFNTNKIRKSDLDGTNIEDVVTSLVNPVDVALDVNNNKIYWTEYNSGKIRRANLDGTSKEDIAVLSSAQPVSVELDLNNNKVYFTDRYKLYVANLDGSSRVELSNTNKNPQGLAVDNKENKVYFGGGLGVFKVDSDGSNHTEIINSGVTGNVWSMAIGTVNLDPVVSFDAVSSNGSESTSSANIAVSIDKTSTSTITVDYAVTGTATGSGTDYALTNGTLTFDPGDLTKNITISNIIDDSINEAHETVIVTLSNPTNATLGGNTVHTYTINDDEISAANAGADQNVCGTATFLGGVAPNAALSETGSWSIISGAGFG